MWHIPLLAHGERADAEHVLEIPNTNPDLLTPAGLEMDNARLRAEIATHIAAACIRELSAPYQPQPPPTSSSPLAAAAVAVPPHSATASPTTSSSMGRVSSRPQSQSGNLQASGLTPSSSGVGPASAASGGASQQSHGELSAVSVTAWSEVPFVHTLMHINIMELWMAGHMLRLAPSQRELACV